MWYRVPSHGSGPCISMPGMVMKSSVASAEVSLTTLWSVRDMKS